MEVGQRAKFVFVAAGIFICYFYYGILQVSLWFAIFAFERATIYNIRTL